MRSHQNSFPAAQGAPTQVPSSRTILLMAPPDVAARVAEALEMHFAARVEFVSDRLEGLAALRAGSFDLVLIEEYLLQADPQGAEILVSGAGAAPVLEVNFGFSSVDRVVRHVRSAFAQRARDEQKARAAALAQLHNQLNDPLSGLLLESQLALKQAGPESAPALQRIVALAGELREQLR